MDATTATNTSVDKANDVDIISLLKAAMTDDNKEIIREFLELMKKCNPVVKVEKKLYPHIKFYENVELGKLSENSIINDILEKFVPRERNYGYDACTDNIYLNLYEFANDWDKSTSAYFFDAVTGMLIHELKNDNEHTLFMRFSQSENNQGYNIAKGQWCTHHDVYHYNLSNKLESIEFKLGDKLLCKVSINDKEIEGRLVIVTDNNIHETYPRKIYEYLNELKANTQLIDEFYLAPTCVKKE